MLLRPLRFAFIALALTAAFAAFVVALIRYADFVAESYGDRRLGRAAPQECEIARVVVSETARWRRRFDEPLELRAFAWPAPVERVGRGIDWRKCAGLGRHVRSVGFARFNSGERGPEVSMSRPLMSADGARVYVSLRASLRGTAARKPEAWTLWLRRSGPSGAWRITRWEPRRSS